MRFARSLIDPRTVARQLVALFGARLVGQLAGYQDPRISYRWVRPTGTTPAAEALRRLYSAHRIWSEVRETRTQEQTSAWFLAPHPLLDDGQPLQFMLDNRFAQVSSAAAWSPRLAQRPDVASGRQPITTALWHEPSLVPILEVARVITDRFGALTAAIVAGEQNPKIAYRWVKNEGKLPTGEPARRLYSLYRTLIALHSFLPRATADVWFLAANPSLDERSPLEAARAGDLHDVADAANHLLTALHRARGNDRSGLNVAR
ncbi:hypothetical protein [Microbacterium sp. A84]|uniref:hypothetical protein n=1 Tax=Microbacterium sp. A84 TaxID=3450715 RepID=UPI003F424AE3